MLSHGHQNRSSVLTHLVEVGVMFAAVAIVIVPAAAQSDVSIDLVEDEPPLVEPTRAPTAATTSLLNLPDLPETAFLAPDMLLPSRTPAPSVQSEGRIIYSRTVAYGSAIGPRFPGPAQSVVTGPTGLILDSLGAGLETLGDDESAGIVGTSNSAVLSALNNPAAGMTGANGTVRTGSDIATGTQTTVISNLPGATVNSAVGQGLGGLSSALGVLHETTGGRK